MSKTHSTTATYEGTTYHHNRKDNHEGQTVDQQHLQESTGGLRALGAPRGGPRKTWPHPIHHRASTVPFSAFYSSQGGGSPKLFPVRPKMKKDKYQHGVLLVRDPGRQGDAKTGCCKRRQKRFGMGACKHGEKSTNSPPGPSGLPYISQFFRDCSLVRLRANRGH